jgi:cytochrome c556
MRTLPSLGIRIAAGGLLTVVCLSTSVAQSARNSPERQAERAVELRQSLFHVVNYAYAPLGDMLKNAAPFDAAVARKSAGLLVSLSPVVKDVFRADTRRFDVKTWAREEIWTQKADFDAKADRFVRAANALADAASGGDQRATLQAAADVGRTCKACHDGYTR